MQSSGLHESTGVLASARQSTERRGGLRYNNAEVETVGGGGAKRGEGK